MQIITTDIAADGTTIVELWNVEEDSWSFIGSKTFATPPHSMSDLDIMAQAIDGYTPELANA